MSLPKPSHYHLIVEHLSRPEFQDTPSPATKQLATLLGKGARLPITAANPRAEIAERMGYLNPIPWATIWLRNAGIKPNPEESCFVVEPVQMVASMNNIAMRPLPSPLNEVQIAELIAALNPILTTDVAQIQHINGQCLLRIAHRLKIITIPLDEARHRDLRDCLPSGEDSGWVRRVMTECQMVLHDLSAFPALAATGVNGVWFWGNTQGAFHQNIQSESPLFSIQLRTSDPWLAALLHLTNKPSHEAPIGIWHGSTQTSDFHDLLTNKIKELWSGQLQKLSISLWQDTEPGYICHLKRHHLLRFWSRPVKLNG